MVEASPDKTENGNSHHVTPEQQEEADKLKAEANTAFKGEAPILAGKQRPSQHVCPVRPVVS